MCVSGNVETETLRGVSGSPAPPLPGTGTYFDGLLTSTTINRYMTLTAPCDADTAFEIRRADLHADEQEELCAQIEFCRWKGHAVGV